MIVLLLLLCVSLLVSSQCLGTNYCVLEKSFLIGSPTFVPDLDECEEGVLGARYTSEQPIYRANMTIYLGCKTNSVLFFNESTCQEAYDYMISQGETPSSSFRQYCNTSGQPIVDISPTLPSVNSSNNSSNVTGSYYTGWPTGSGSGCSPYCGWSANFSNFTGDPYAAPICPPYHFDSNGYPVPNGSSYDHWIPLVCGNKGRAFNVSGQNDWVRLGQCLGGIDCAPPWVNTTDWQCRKNAWNNVVTGCRYTSGGCWEGYPSRSYCNSYYAGCLETFEGSGRWCPTANGYQDPVICYLNGVPNQNCQDNYINGLHVNGDEMFCSQYSCDNTRACTCKFMNILNENVYQGLNMSTYTVTLVSLNSREARGIDSSNFVSDSEETFFASLEGDNMVLKFQSAGVRSVLVVKSPAEAYSTCIYKICIVELSEDFFIDGSTATITVFQNQTVTGYMDVYVPARNKCIVYDCILCWQTYDTWDCAPTSYKVLIGLTIAFLCLLIIISFPYVGVAIIWCLGVLWAILKMFWYWTGKCWSWVKKKIPEDAMRLPRPATAMAILMLFCVLSDAQICSNNYALVVNQTACVTSGSDTICQGEVAGDINLRFIGDSACFNLMANESTVGNLELTYIGIERTYVFADYYYTSNWEALSYFNVRCNQIDGCNAANCLAANANVRNPFHVLDGQELLAYPGETFCDAVCDKPGLQVFCDGCVLFRPGCGVSAYGIRPVGHPMIMKKLFQIIDKPTVRVRAWINNTEVLDAMVVDEFIDEHFNMQIVGTYAVAETEALDGRYLMQVLNDNDLYLTEASSFNSPEHSKAGDIQSSTLESLLSVNPDAFIMAGLLKAKYENNAGVVLDFYESGASFAMRSGKATKLPGAFKDEELVISSNSTLKTQLKNPGAVAVSFFSDTVVFVKQETVVCPDNLEFVDITGCYSCETGATIHMAARSECTAGYSYGNLSCGTLRNNVFLLQEESTEFEVTFDTGDQEVDCTFCLYSATVECIDFSGSLKTVTLKNLTAENRTAEVQVKEDDEERSKWNPVRWFEDIFKGIASWWEWILAILFITAIVIVAIILVPVAFTLLSYILGWIRYWKNLRAKGISKEEWEKMRERGELYDPYGPWKGNAPLSEYPLMNSKSSQDQAFLNSFRKND